MSTHQDYMDERMLHAFLDGELDGAHEELLFEKLSSDGALRSEMQQHLAMRKAIQHDNEAFTPPAAATSAVFAALGFSLPPLAAEAAPAGGFGAAGGFGVAGGLGAAGSGAAGAGSGTFRQVALSAAAAVLAILAALFLSMQFPAASPDLSGTSERVVSVPPTMVEIQETPALGDLPVASVPARNALPAASAPAQEQASANRDLRIFDARDLDMRPIAALTASEKAAPEPERIRAGDVQFFDLIPAPDGVTLYARNVALRSDPSPAVVSQSEPWFHNMNIGALYALSDHHAIGIEGGQEAFPQTFSGIEGGRSVRYEQNPMAYWATAVYQFNGDALLPHVHPFAQAQAGGAFGQAVNGGMYWLGPLARATLGVKLRPFERIAIVAGLEGTMLLYRFQGSWFDTNKLGLTYGVSYEF